MYVMAEGLTRLLAPVLPMTTDELWRHLPGTREASVHLADFPADTAAMVDPPLVERWERLIAVRNAVNQALEIKRQDKTIGTSLGARLTVRTGGATAALLDQYRDDLPMLFIVSQVEVDTHGDGAGALEIEVTRAEGEKCPRCWRVVTAVSSAPDTEGLCERCADALSTTAGPLAG
jgi:isoleucyl-tRNA synthetase